jgi:hypothetical protein
MQCHRVESEILGRIEYEKQFNEQNFDSGWTVEEIIRQELGRLLPRRYSVYAGSISDSKGFTAGDCDVIVFNDLWFPVIKSGPTPQSRKTYLPIEGVYSVLEVKQTLTLKALDDAMEKLVTCHRLFRPSSSIDRLVENDMKDGCTHFVSNPLFSGVVAAGLPDNVQMDDVATRFIRINQLLPRKDVVHTLCVLGRGTIVWGYRPWESSDLAQPSELHPATFMREDRYSRLVPVYGRTEADDSPFYDLTLTLLRHLNSSVLAPENIAVHYGHNTKARTPATDDATLDPDPSLLPRLSDSCVGKHTSTENAYHPDSETAKPQGSSDSDTDSGNSNIRNASQG